MKKTGVHIIKKRNIDLGEFIVFAKTKKLFVDYNYNYINSYCGGIYQGSLEGEGLKYYKYKFK